MSPQDCFRYLSKHVESQEMPTAFKREVLAALVYFKVQAEMPIEERAHPRELRKAWLELSERCQGLKIFDIVKSEDLTWRTVLCFVHAEEPTSLLLPKEEKVKPTSPYAKWDNVDFFAHLSREVNARSHLTPFENLSLNVGLWFLESEASKARGSRKPERIKSTWSSIRPLLDRMGLLKEFQFEERLRHQLNFFINDKMD